MAVTVAITLVAIFSALALLHLYWAAGGRALKLAAIPEIDGRRAFAPSATGTVAVAFALFAAALLTAVASGLLSLPVPSLAIEVPVFALALILFARAIGDFRLVGFFKRVHGSRFARLDTIVFSPLCLALAGGVFFVGWSRFA
jgi:Protein of unknown function (DUF3995)